MTRTRPAPRTAAVLLALLAPLSQAAAQMTEPEPGSNPAMLTEDENQPQTEPQTQPQTEPAEPAQDQPVRPRGGRLRPGGPPGAAPRLTQPGQPPAADPNEPMVSFGAFSEPMQLTTLIDFVGSSLGLNIVVKGSPQGEIVFNAPIEVPQSQLLDLLDAMLEQYSYTITHEPATGFYVVQPITDVKPSLTGDRSSVRIIPTPNIRPSQLVPTLMPLLSTAGAAPGGAAPTGGAIQAVDELGVLIVTAPTRDIARIEGVLTELMRIDAAQQRIRFELEHIAAPAALERAIGLVGAAGTQSTNMMQNQNMNRGRFQENQPGGVSPTGTTGGSLSNLADRITVDPQGNALIFRGRPEEIERVRAILNVIDVPNKLQPKEYFAGSAAAQVADIASRRGLGEVVQVSTDQSSALDQFNPFRQQQFNNGQFQPDQQTSIGGPVMVVDVERGRIIYYGTEQQQMQLSDLMQELRTDDERVVIREYVLNHSDAETVADLLTGIITGQRQTGDSPLLPTQGGVNNRQLNQGQGGFFNPFQQGGGDEVSAAFDPDVVTVIPDIENNQVVVKAPIKQQEELAKLIERLDRRRAQVYIQAQIVAVTDNEDFTLAFETQYLRGDFGIGTNFGLSNISDGTNFTDPKDISAGLSGLTTAIIRSDYVPLIINATQTDTDVRILSSPQVLVNDNEEASIVSIEEQPYSTTNFGNDVDSTTFGGYETAGTQLTVTPSISDGGFLRLEYEIELSNFITASGTGDLPPPKNTRTVTGKATIPTDATIVIGGLTVEDVRDTVIKVPFIGDIPLLGELFKRTNKVNNKARLYVFLTPRIMTDPNFNDLKLLTSGPQAEMKIDPDAPPLEPMTIRSIPTPASDDAPALTPESIN